jgi:hypothetical protein
MSISEAALIERLVLVGAGGVGFCGGICLIFGTTGPPDDADNGAGADGVAGVDDIDMGSLLDSRFAPLDIFSTFSCSVIMVVEFYSLLFASVTCAYCVCNA